MLSERDSVPGVPWVPYKRWEPTRGQGAAPGICRVLWVPTFHVPVPGVGAPRTHPPPPANRLHVCVWGWSREGQDLSSFTTPPSVPGPRPAGKAACQERKVQAACESSGTIEAVGGSEQGLPLFLPAKAKVAVPRPARRESRGQRGQRVSSACLELVCELGWVAGVSSRLERPPFPNPLGPVRPSAARPCAHRPALPLVALARDRACLTGWRGVGIKITNTLKAGFSSPAPPTSGARGLSRGASWARGDVSLHPWPPPARCQRQLQHSCDNH